MTDIVVSSGQTSTGLLIGDGDSLGVDSGGTVESITVLDSGFVGIDSGGLAIGTLIESGGEQDIAFGAVDSTTTILSGGEEKNEGSAIGLTVSSGGILDDSLGGTDLNTVVYAGGDEYLGRETSFTTSNTDSGLEILYELQGGSALSTTLSGGLQVVSGGSTADNTTVLSGGVQFVGYDAYRVDLTADTASGTVVESGGTVVAFAEQGTAVLTSAGAVYYTVVASGDQQVTTFGAAAGSVAGDSITLVADPHDGTVTQTDSASGASGIVATYSGYIDFPSVVSNATIQSGGTIILAGGATPGLVVESGATEIIGGPISYPFEGYTLTETGLTISDNVVSAGVSAFVESGNVEAYGSVAIGGYEEVQPGGIASGTTVSGSVATVDSVVESSGGQLVIDSGGSATGITVQGGGLINVQSGGIVGGVELDDEALLSVSEGGSAVSAVISSGGSGIVAGLIESGLVQSGGSLYVESGGIIDGVAIDSGGTGFIEPNATVDALTVSSGGTLDDFASGTEGGDTIDSGGTENVESAAVVNDLVVQDGASVDVLAGGTVDDLSIQSGGDLTVSAGGVASATTVEGGGQLSAGDGASVVSATLQSGGMVDLASGAVASDTNVQSGADWTLSAHAEAIQTMLAHDAILQIQSGAMESGGQISGEEIVASGGVAIGDVLTSGGTLSVESGGVASGLTAPRFSFIYVSPDGVLDRTYLESGAGLTLPFQASAVDTMLDSGASLLVQSGAMESGGQISGEETVASGGVAIGDVLASGGTLSVESGAVASDTSIQSGGLLRVSTDGGEASGITVSSGGEVYVDSGGTGTEVTLDGGTIEYASGSIAGSDSIDFSGISGTLVIDGPVLPSNLISGFATTDLIHLTGIAYDPSGGAELTSGNVLVITEDETEFTFNLDPTQSFAGDQFEVIADPSAEGGIDVEEVACYLRGTLIGTPTGPVPIEELRIGDQVSTLGGAALPIQWIGRRSYSGRFAAANPRVRPICVRAGALSEGVPGRDLWVSPDHALWIEGMLVPAGLLVNGSSIVRAGELAEIHYVHLEFERHAVIFAEQAPSESFVDDGSRGMFQNAFEPAAAQADPGPREGSPFCAPRLEEGFLLETIRNRLAARARWQKAS